MIVQFKAEIERARGNPTEHLDHYVRENSAILRDAKRDPNTPDDAIAGLEDELRDKLPSSQNASYLEQVPARRTADLIQTYKFATGQLTPFDAPLDDYARYRKVEAKTAAKDRYVIEKFAGKVSSIQAVNKQAERDFVRYLSVEEGRKKRRSKTTSALCEPTGNGYRTLP
nr:hypothetical protein [Thalassorhabdomicrobium marinisediminis]